MELTEAILKRRSIRKYKPEAVEQEKINRILKAAMYAPSAMNYQPWEFIVVTDKEKMLKIFEVNSHAEMLKQSPLVIIVCGDSNKERVTEYNVQNCSAATQNLLLAVHNEGLGAVWIGAYPNGDVQKALKDIFSLPENIVPFTITAIGYPDEAPEAEERFDRNKIHHNNW